jgi:hypothetical protein
MSGEPADSAVGKTEEHSMRQVTENEFAAVTALVGADRYAYFIRHVADTQELWSLKSAEGWVLMAAGEGLALVPVWPHPRYAQGCAEDEWEGAEPAAIPLDRWLERWTPGMAQDGRHVAVFPIPGGQGVVVYPERLREDLRAECSQYE